MGTGFMDLKVDISKLPKSVLFKEEGVSEDPRKTKIKPASYNLK